MEKTGTPGQGRARTNSMEEAAKRNSYGNQSFRTAVQQQQPGGGGGPGGPGGGWRLSEVDSVLVGGTRGPAPHTEITLNRTMQCKDVQLSKPRLLSEDLPECQWGLW